MRAKATERGISANQLCAELETQRGKNLALAASSPGLQKTLERYVYSSLGKCVAAFGRQVHARVAL